MQRRFAVLFTWCPYLLTESFALLIRMGMFGVHPIPCVINREVFFFCFLFLGNLLRNLSRLDARAFGSVCRRWARKLKCQGI